MTSRNLVFKAGPGALDTIRRHGFAPDRIGTIAGASGSAKWLVLSHLDRAILSNIVPQLTGPVHLIGTSIGAWRFACYAQADPHAAIERFERAYIEQSYSDAPDVHEISEKSHEIIRELLGDGGVGEILSHTVFRTHVLTARARNIAAFEQRLVLAASLMIAAGLNAVSRRSLAWSYERALFFDGREIPPFFDVSGFPLQRIMLKKENLKDAILATGSIPLVMSGVRDIAGATPGMYRDGGIIDYHLDLPLSDPDRLTLYPHFYDRIVPGWFDKKLSWRQPDPANMDRVILLSPSAEFVARLPGQKIPDRTDFTRYSPGDRIRLWHGVVAECERLADEFNEVIEKGELEARLTPL